ncbi:MAG: hypothetical protein AAF438_05310 [Pseudomonadota bacterium]
MRRYLLPTPDEIRQNWFAPIGVNIASAAILFLCAILFKTQILAAFGGDAEKHGPIHIIAEPINDQDGHWNAELYVFNLENRPFARAELEDRLNDPDALFPSEPDLQLTWEGTASKQILSVLSDTEFNHEKGTFEIQNNDNRWRISIDTIAPNAILKFYIQTNLKRDAHRNAKVLPFSGRLADQRVL